MAKKKLIFDPNEEPEAGYNKWVQEYLRLIDIAPSQEPVESDEQLEARKNFNYFKQKMNEAARSEKREPEAPRTSDEYYKPYKPPKKKKPFVGWEHILEKL